MDHFVCRGLPEAQPEAALGGGPKGSNAPHADVLDATTETLIDRLFRSEGPRLQRYFRRQMRPDEDVRDFVQESFLRLASVASRALPVQPAAYLQRIARNLLIDRSRRAEPPPVGDVDQCGMPPAQEEAMLAGELMATYEMTLNDMPERTRTIFLLYRVDGLRYREIAERLDISIPAVQKHMAKALESLAWALQGGE